MKSLSLPIANSGSRFSNQLEQIRSQRAQRSQLLSGILDIKLREIGKLDSKQEILDSCQNWMRDKVLYYMNLQDESQMKYYLQAEELTSKLTSKQVLVQEQGRIIGDLQKQMEMLEGNLAVLKQENETMERTLQRQFQFKDEDMKKYVSINKLESANTQLAREVNMLTKQNLELFEKYQKEKAENVTNKSEISLLQNQVLRLRARLQDNQPPIDENIKYIGEYKICYALSISLKPDIKQPKRMIGQKFLRQVMIDGLIVRNKHPKKSEEVKEYFLNQGPKIREEGTQTANPYLWITKTTNVMIEGRARDGALKKNSSSAKELNKEEKLQRLKDSFARELTSLKKEVKRMLAECEEISNRRFINLAEERDELIQLLSNRPSREQDITYIHTLQQENKELISLSSEANQKAETAYTAMSELKTQLDRYKQNTTIMVRSKVRRPSNIECETINPCTTSYSQSHRVSWSVNRKRSRNKSRDEDVMISSIIRDSLGSVDLSMKHGRKLNSSLSAYRDEFNKTMQRSIL